MSVLAPSAADFPTLPHTGVAYLDSGATSQTPIPVIEAMDAYYREYRASVHRGVYPIAALATDAYEGARARVAAFAGSSPGVEPAKAATLSRAVSNASVASAASG